MATTSNTVMLDYDSACSQIKKLDGLIEELELIIKDINERASMIDSYVTSATGTAAYFKYLEINSSLKNIKSSLQSDRNTIKNKVEAIHQADMSSASTSK